MAVPWELTASALERLLVRLDPDPARAAEAYEALRLSLTRFFDWRGAHFPDECADETMNRGPWRDGSTRAPPLPTSGASLSASPASCGSSGRAARRCARTSWTRSGLGRPRRRSSATSSRACTSAWRCVWHRWRPTCGPTSSRHYQDQRRQKIDRRVRLATQLGLSANALRSRAQRVRDRLERCAGRAAPAGTPTRNPRRRTYLEATRPATGLAPPPCDRRTMPLDVVTPEIRRYLLGDLDEAGAAALEDRYVADPALLEQVRAAEDALIEAFRRRAPAPGGARQLRGALPRFAGPPRSGWRLRGRCASGRRERRSRPPPAVPGSTAGWRWPRRWCSPRSGLFRAAARRRSRRSFRRLHGRSRKLPRRARPRLRRPRRPRRRPGLFLALTLSPTATRGGDEATHVRPDGPIDLAPRLEGTPAASDRAYDAELQTVDGRVMWRGRGRAAAAGSRPADHGAPARRHAAGGRLRGRDRDARPRGARPLRAAAQDPLTARSSCLAIRAPRPEYSSPTFLVRTACGPTRRRAIPPHAAPPVPDWPHRRLRPACGHGPPRSRHKRHHVRGLVGRVRGSSSTRTTATPKAASRPTASIGPLPPARRWRSSRTVLVSRPAKRRVAHHPASEPLTGSEPAGDALLRADPAPRRDAPSTANARHGRSSPSISTSRPTSPSITRRSGDARQGRTWLTTAPRAPDRSRPASLDVGPALVLSGNPDAQRVAFHDASGWRATARVRRHPVHPRPRRGRAGGDPQAGRAQSADLIASRALQLRRW